MADKPIYEGVSFEGGPEVPIQTFSDYLKINAVAEEISLAVCKRIIALEIKNVMAVQKKTVRQLSREMGGTFSAGELKLFVAAADDTDLNTLLVVAHHLGLHFEFSVSMI